MGEALMLIVTELGEAMEGYRKQDHDNFRESLRIPLSVYLIYAVVWALIFRRKLLKSLKKINSARISTAKFAKGCRPKYFNRGPVLRGFMFRSLCVFLILGLIGCASCKPRITLGQRSRICGNSIRVLILQ